MVRTTRLVILFRVACARLRHRAAEINRLPTAGRVSHFSKFPETVRLVLSLLPGIRQICLVEIGDNGTRMRLRRRKVIYGESVSKAINYQCKYRIVIIML